MFQKKQKASLIPEQFYSLFNATYNYYQKLAAVPRCFSKQLFLKFAIFIGKRLFWSLFLVKLQAWRLVTLLKRESNTDVFSCEQCEVFKKTLFKEQHRWLLLYFKFIGNLLTHTNWEIDDIYFQYNTLCLYHEFLHLFRYQFC